jgi:hypothetical protein
MIILTAANPNRFEGADRLKREMSVLSTAELGTDAGPCGLSVEVVEER